MAWKAAKAREPLDEAALYEYAVGALGRRMRTADELRRLMRPRVEKGETGEGRIDTVLARLKAQNYVNDELFAADYTRLRQEGAKLGRRRVQGDLQRKGVDGGLVASTLDAAYADVNEEELARQFLERKRMRKPENDRESARIMRRLVAAGFSFATIGRLLRRWNVNDSLVMAVEQADLPDRDES